MKTKQTTVKVLLATSLLASVFLLAGCQSSLLTPSIKQQTELNTAYDYQLYTSNWQATSVTQITQELTQADVIFIGEFHGNHAAHLLQTQLLAALYQKNPKLILSMEMFNRDQQETLNEYLDGFIGEQTLINDAPAWPNYKASYRPTVEFAKQHFLPVIAANASGDLVRCIGSQGEAYLDKLDNAEQQWIATQPFAEISGYKTKFFGFMQGAKHQAESSRANNTYLAQLTRDNTMAESILKAMQANKGSQVIHLNGSFHSENHLGTAGALKRMAPQLNIQVITPLYIDQLNEAKADSTRIDDYYYTLNPQPAEYVQSENRRQAHQRMFENARKKAKACK